MARSAEEIATGIVETHQHWHGAIPAPVAMVVLIAAAVTEAHAEQERQDADDLDELADLHAAEGGTSAEVASIRWCAEQLRAHFTEPKGKGNG